MDGDEDRGRGGAEETCSGEAAMMSTDHIKTEQHELYACNQSQASLILISDASQQPSYPAHTDPATPHTSCPHSQKWP